MNTPKEKFCSCEGLWECECPHAKEHCRKCGLPFDALFIGKVGTLSNENFHDMQRKTITSPPQNVENICTCASFFTIRGVHKKDCPQNVGEVLEKVDQQVGGALRALGGMNVGERKFVQIKIKAEGHSDSTLKIKPRTPRGEEKECVCGHWESRHRPFCDVGDNADKCSKFVSVEKEDEALLKIAEERDLERDFLEAFPDLAIVSPGYEGSTYGYNAEIKVLDWLTNRLKKEREQLAKDIHDMKLREGSEMEDEYMCPNCCTPWKCNGPHISDPEQWNDALEQVLALLGESDKYYAPDTKE